MLIKSIFIPLVIILFAQLANATEVLHVPSDIATLENQSCNRPRTESWSQRADVSQAIDACKKAGADLEDVFATCVHVWKNTPSSNPEQPFIGDKKSSDAEFVANAPNTRYIHIFEFNLLIEKVKSNFDLLTRNVDSENYDECFTGLEQVKMNTICNLLYSRVNSSNGMRDYGLTFSKVTKPEWNGENALYRFSRIIGNPYTGERGTLQKKFEALLSTIDACTF